MKSLQSSEDLKKIKREKMCEYDLEDLKEHIDQISFNLGKSYQRAKDRSRKYSARAGIKKKMWGLHLYDES